MPSGPSVRRLIVAAAVFVLFQRLVPSLLLNAEQFYFAPVFVIFFIKPKAFNFPRPFVMVLHVILTRILRKGPGVNIQLLVRDIFLLNYFCTSVLYHVYGNQCVLYWADFYVDSGVIAVL